MDYDALDMPHLRRQIGLVAQHVLLRSGTIWDNLVFGNDDIAAAEALETSRIAGVHDFVEMLPKGYETPVERAATPAFLRVEAATGHRPRADAAACRPDLR